ncbi:MAG: lipopolysaccharide biosynthesis protein RfbH [Myxococcales bacterium]|nr:lipopolysaccharide biosynthesis protein RfbH [Myxococcales bacterium]
MQRNEATETQGEPVESPQLKLVDGVRERRAREKALRGEIMERVRELAALKTTAAPFSPGRSMVRYAARVYGEQEMVNLVDSALEFWLTAGRYHSRLEKGLARWYGVPQVKLVNSGSSANLLATASLTSHVWGDRRLRPGDEVITVAAGFPTTVAPMIQMGLVPVFVDIELPSYNINPALLEQALSPKTRAIMLAHTLGNPFDLDAVCAFCREHDLWLIEDNCDASGSLYKGQLTGTFGDLATLSFYPPHHMTTGEGGAVLCRTDELARVAESFRDWGRDCWCRPGADNTCGKRFCQQMGALPEGYDHKYTYSHLGFNLKITDMQAAVGCAQLERLGAFGDKRRENWAWLRAALADLEDVLVLPEPTPGSDPSWFGFMITVRPDAPFHRRDLVRHLEASRVQTRMLFGGNLLRQPALTELWADREAQGMPAPWRVASGLEVTDQVMDAGFWIGVYPGMQEEELAWMCDRIRGFARGTEGER